MGKQGPCYHCGVSSTPLWRNGPPEKPVLCNACGSRWRTKGTLTNYTPLHSRAETDEPEDYKVSRVKTVSLKNKEMQTPPKRKLNNDLIVGRIKPAYNNVSQKSQDDDTRNRSSSGSAISNTESCGQFGYEDASDLTDPTQTIVWERMTPSKKRRTCIAQPKVSSVEKLTRDLCIILKEQQESSQFSLSSQGDLIFENDKPMVSVEIGHGSMLIQCPSSIARGEEESEASSLSFDNKLLNEAHSSSPPFSMNSHKVAQTCPNLEADKLKRDMSQQIMGTHNPQLLYVDLSDIVNYDVFTHFLSREEQQQLLKHLPSLDTANLPHSLESMFTSIQFKENIISYQKLLSEECRPLKKLPLFNVSETKQLEQYDSIFKDVKGKGKEEKENGEVGNSTNTKRTWNNSFKFSGSAASCKSPDKIIMEGSNDKEDKSCNQHFVPKNLLSFPPDGGSLMIDSSSQFVDKPYDEDLLFVPSNSSFPEAELLILPSSTFGSKASTSNNSKVPSRFV